MTGNDSEETAEERHRRGTQSESSKNLSKAEPNLSIKVKIEKPFRLPDLVSLFDCGGGRDQRSHLRGHSERQLRHFAAEAKSGRLHLRFRTLQRISQNIERFVEIGTGMFGCYASPKANSVLRNSRVIDRRNPQASPTQFVAKPVHPL